MSESFDYFCGGGKDRKTVTFPIVLFLIADVLEFFNKSVIRTFWFLASQFANS